MTATAPLRARAIPLLAAALLAAGVLATAPTPLLAAAPRPTLPPSAGATEQPGDPVDDQILIRYREGTSTARRLAVRQAHGLTRVPGSGDARTDVVVATGRSTATVKRQLADDRSVEAVAPNQRRELTDDITAEPGFKELWGLHNTGQRLDGTTVTTGVSDIDIDGYEALRLGTASSDVVVAVIDDGVDVSHPDLVDALWTNPGEAGALADNGVDDDGNGFVDDVHGWDFCNDDATLHDPGEDGHGTHVAGTIGASLNGSGIVGVAPGVSIMVIKFIDDGPFCGSDDMAVQAIDYAASFGVPIINASWGGPSPSAVLDAAIADSGALFVAAAGNGGRDIDAVGGQRFYPASSTLPNILAVAAVDQRGRMPGFSDYGRKSVDLAAPGTNILSTYPAFQDCPDPCYAWSAGTSMAAPHVSGVAALVASTSTALRDDELKLRGRLLATGKALASLSGKTSTGRMVNAFRAVDPVPPITKAPDRFTVPSGSTVGSTTTPLRVSWPPAVDEATSVRSYGLKKKAGSTWTTVTSSTTSTAVVTDVRHGTGTTFRLTATDAPGSTSAGKDSPAITTTLYSDGASLARYGHGWTTTSSASALGGKVHTARAAGATVTFRFTGRSIAIVAPRSSSRGAFKVYVDDVLMTTVDLQRATIQSRRAVFSMGWTDRTTHTIKVVTVNTRRVDIDGFVVAR